MSRFFRFIKRIFEKPTFCPVCGVRGAGFARLSSYFTDNAIKYGYGHFGKGEMTALETYSCLKCGASDRERLCAYWICQQVNGREFSAEMKIMHFAPEQALSRMLKEHWPLGYQTADLEMAECDYKVNIMQTPFADGIYDFFVCNHVLEHVDSDDRAVAELYRITKTGGCGILLAPISTDLKHTLEDPTIIEEAERWKYYGQNDHVRLYSHDHYVEKIKRHGFTVRELDQNFFGEKVFSRLGLKETSILYIAEK